ncbi:hypothetical protein ACP8HI_24020 [Paenibacillus sp. FA6]|uniref:hypothetical protein n=1 Tax=Paenibacillus sp. FA6 TaxID=3413029 RepID=UPI003F65EA42
MKLHLNGVTEEMSQGVAQLADMLGFQLHPDGLVIDVIQEEGPLIVSLIGCKGRMSLLSK